jgi:hypothetical protein
MHVTKDQIGEDGVAHLGKLNEAEYFSIERRRDRERVWIWDVTRGLATGGGISVVSESESTEAD